MFEISAGWTIFASQAKPLIIDLEAKGIEDPDSLSVRQTNRYVVVQAIQDVLDPFCDKYASEFALPYGNGVKSASYDGKLLTITFDLGIRQHSTEENEVVIHDTREN